jgi:hypothetical protein
MSSVPFSLCLFPSIQSDSEQKTAESEILIDAAPSMAETPLVRMTDTCPSLPKPG